MPVLAFTIARVCASMSNASRGPSGWIDVMSFRWVPRGTTKQFIDYTYIVLSKAPVIARLASRMIR